MYQRASDQRWVGTVTLPNGKRQSVYGPTQRAARQRMRQMQREIDDGSPLTGRRGLTVGAFLAIWVNDTLPARVRAGRMTHSTRWIPTTTRSAVTSSRFSVTWRSRT